MTSPSGGGICGSQHQQPMALPTKKLKNMAWPKYFLNNYAVIEWSIRNQTKNEQVWEYNSHPHSAVLPVFLPNLPASPFPPFSPCFCPSHPFLLFSCFSPLLLSFFYVSSLFSLVLPFTVYLICLPSPVFASFSLFSTLCRPIS